MASMNSFRGGQRLVLGGLMATCTLLVLHAPLAAAQSKAEPADDTAALRLAPLIVTSQKRAENALDVPASVTVLSGDQLESKFTSGDTILALAAAVPGLYAETSGGRTAPRFYMRGLGNGDFNQAASQPVSIEFDDVPLEKSGLRAFPLFDVDSVEVLRGPQGTLFGRNTTAGVVKIKSKRPTDEFEGSAKLALASFGTTNAELAISGPLIDDTLTGRVSLLSLNRNDWIDNDFNGQNDVIGGFEQLAARTQLLWTPTEDFSALGIFQHGRLRGNSSTPFRANVLTRGSNELNQNFDRDSVFYDGGGNQVSDADHTSATFNIEAEIPEHTITSISSYQYVERIGRADVDGGFGFAGQPNGPGFIPFPADTGSDSEITQRTQELRIASNTDRRLGYQAGLFYFDDELDFTDLTTAERAAFRGALGVRSTTVLKAQSWAIFGQGSYELTDKLKLTAGLRYTDEQKEADYSAPVTSSRFALIQTLAPIEVSDENLSWDVSASYQTGDAGLIYGRLASGFRAPTIQTTVSANPDLITADSETILSYELGYKADLSDRLRLNTAVFYYTVDDIQLTAVGGDNPDGGVSLVNAEQGVGYGLELDLEYAATESLRLTGGFGYNHTEYMEEGLSTGVCISCTVTDPLNARGRALIDGNPFQHVPLWTLNGEIEYLHPVSGSGEVFVLSDWKFKGETNDFLYESIEYVADTQFEGGLRVGYRNLDRGFELALFGRNITDEENVLGGIDFNNLTAYVNEPRVVGVELKAAF